MNIADKLTISRFALAFVVIGGLLGYEKGVYLAFGAFAVAALSDMLDGRIARRYCGSTPMGALLDPMADKVFVLACYLALLLASDLRVPVVAVALIGGREIGVSFMRTMAMVRGRLIAADEWGKTKTLTQMIGIGIMFAILLIEKSTEGYPTQAFLHRIGAEVAFWLIIFAAFSSVVSGLKYARDYARVLRGEKGEKFSGEGDHNQYRG